MRKRVTEETWSPSRARDWTPLGDLPDVLEPPDEEEEDVMVFLSQEMAMAIDEVEDGLYSLARQAINVNHEDLNR